MALRLSTWLRRISLARIQEMIQVLGAVEHAGTDPKEPDASGFAGAEEGDSRYA
jgi:hypothetical protein